MDQIDSADGIARVLKGLMDAMRDNEDGQAQIRAVGEKYEKGSLEKLTAQLEKFVELRLQANPESRSKQIQGREGDLAKLIINLIVFTTSSFHSQKDCEISKKNICSPDPLW